MMIRHLKIQVVDKFDMVRRIRSGWKAMEAGMWGPKGTEPSVDQLCDEFFRRMEAMQLKIRSRPAHWTWSKCVHWLEMNNDETVLPNTHATAKKRFQWGFFSD